MYFIVITKIFAANVRIPERGNKYTFGDLCLPYTISVTKDKLRLYVPTENDANPPVQRNISQELHAYQSALSQLDHLESIVLRKADKFAKFYENGIGEAKYTSTEEQEWKPSTRVLVDIWHVMNRIKVPRRHGAVANFCRDLRDAIFIRDPNDEKSIKAYLEANGIFSVRFCF